jgi:hypothetical protein
VAKKVRRKSEDEDFSFEFPEFDEAGFVWKESEITVATAIAGVMALVLGLVDWGLTAVGVPWFATLALGVVAVVGSVFLIRTVRPGSKLYTTGDWAGLIALEFFGWLSIWFLLLNLAPNL